MGAKRKKSKKRSAANSGPLHKRLVFFIERNLGRRAVPEALKAAGELVEVHFDHLPDASGDEDWISLVGRRGWLAITKDARIRYRENEKRAILKHRARVFVLRARDVTGPEMGEILVAASRQIKAFAQRHIPPFIAAIHRDGKIKPYPL